jgi:hypothetical protein
MPVPCPTHDPMAPSHHAQADHLGASWQPAATQVHRWSAPCLRLLIGMGNEANWMCLPFFPQVPDVLDAVRIKADGGLDRGDPQPMGQG